MCLEPVEILEKDNSFFEIDGTINYVHALDVPTLRALRCDSWNRIFVIWSRQSNSYEAYSGEINERNIKSKVLADVKDSNGKERKVSFLENISSLLLPFIETYRVTPKKEAHGSKH